MNYRVLQVAVLLITAGTILGGLWADVSWGRFWGWDPKEVGALIALLIIMTALHGRRAGWHGDLSIAIGSVCGFAGVMWAWYVVNFILNAGKHAYGNESGETGQWMWLIAVVSIQSLYIAAALARVTMETRRSAEIT
jgi:ABC-type transport system involved in cytochrome c biogenesis permease subunit